MVASSPAYPPSAKMSQERSKAKLNVQSATRSCLPTRKCQTNAVGRAKISSILHVFSSGLPAATRAHVRCAEIHLTMELQIMERGEGGGSVLVERK